MSQVCNHVSLFPTAPSPPAFGQVALRGKGSAPNIQEPLVVYKDDAGDAHDAMASGSSSSSSDEDEDDGSDGGMSQVRRCFTEAAHAALIFSKGDDSGDGEDGDDGDGSDANDDDDDDDDDDDE
jgi:hypothetical protein